MSEYSKSRPPSFLGDGTPVVLPPISDSFRKSQYLLGFTIANLFLHTALDHVLFVTLTFPEPVLSVKQAKRLLDSLLKSVRDRYSDYLWVMEPQGSGRIHYHLLVPVKFDAHNGTDLDAFRDRDFHNDNPLFFYRSMNPLLRAQAVRNGLPDRFDAALDLLNQLHADRPPTGFTEAEIARGREAFQALCSSHQDLLLADPTEEGLEPWTGDPETWLSAALDFQQTALEAFVAELEKRGAIQVSDRPQSRPRSNHTSR